MVQVPLDFIQDTFNHADLKQFFNHYDEAYEQLIAAIETNDEDLLNGVESLILYGLLHKRYIYTDLGLQKLQKLVVQKNYGTCLRQGCNDCPLAPIGISDRPGIAPFSVYCCKCNELYLFSGENEVDGSFFGVECAHLLYLKYPTLLEKFRDLDGTDEDMSYCGTKLFGFEITWDRMKAK